MSGEGISGEEFNAACQLVRQALAVLEDNGETLAVEDRAIALRYLADALDVIDRRRLSDEARRDLDNPLGRDRGDLKSG